MKFICTACTLLALVLLGSGCTLVTEHRLADGSKNHRSYRTLAGSVHIGRDASVHRAKTIAGEIQVDHGAATQSLGTVAGDIEIGESVNVDGDVSTVAGEIRIGTDTHVTGKVSSIAGDIVLDGCRIDGPVRITKGSLETRGAVRLPGGVVVRHSRSSDEKNITRVDIGAAADIASIHVEPGANAEVRISRNARVGEVTGATATYY